MAGKNLARKLIFGAMLIYVYNSVQPEITRVKKEIRDYKDIDSIEIIINEGIRDGCSDNTTRLIAKYSNAKVEFVHSGCRTNVGEVYLNGKKEYDSNNADSFIKYRVNEDFNNLLRIFLKTKKKLPNYV